MKSTGQKKDAGDSLSPKWIFVIIIALALGFGTYGYFKVKQWVRYAAIEKYEKPISDYTITKVYADDHKPKSHRGYGDDDAKESEPNYYMDVSYKGKDYKLEIEEYTYNNYNNTGNVTLYYDSKGDDVFVAGTGGSNLLVTALAAVVLVVVILILLIWLIIKAFKKKKEMPPLSTEYRKKQTK